VIRSGPRTGILLAVVAFAAVGLLIQPILDGPAWILFLVVVTALLADCTNAAPATQAPAVTQSAQATATSPQAPSPSATGAQAQQPAVEAATPLKITATSPIPFANCGGIALAGPTSR